jgi:hypothetical protein
VRAQESLLGQVLGDLVRDVRSSIARRSWGLRGSCRRGGCGSRRYANSYRDVENFQNDVGALVVDGAFEYGIDHMHDGGLMASVFQSGLRGGFWSRHEFVRP